MNGMGNNKSWGGRFSEKPSTMLMDYTDSQRFDRALYAEDILASKAHAHMLGKQGIITSMEASQILAGLDRILDEIESGKFVWKPEYEDVHMNIEARLVDLIGAVGKKLHTGRSRNDQVGLTFRLYVSRKCGEWQKSCLELCKVLLELARKNRDVILPGFTHLQPAQPVSLAQHLLAYAGMFKRDVERLDGTLSRIGTSPLGAAALAGSTYPLDPWMVADEVGFKNIYDNSMDAVSDRDFVMESQFVASVIMAHLSRLCEEIILWANPCFGFITLPDDYSTGSSIMPQKKNPDVAELMRGKTGRVYGNLMAILTIMKGLPLTYNRDLQEDKEVFLDTDKTVLPSLEIMSAMLPKIVFNRQNMADACSKGFLNATEVADYLVSKGLPFRDAHHVTGKIVATAEKRGKSLTELGLEEFKAIEPRIENDIYPVLDYGNCVKRRETPGGTGPDSVNQQLVKLTAWLKNRL